MTGTQEKLIGEEQEVLDELLQRMDRALEQSSESRTYDEFQIKKAKDSCLPEAYGALVAAEQNKEMDCQRIKYFQKGRDELYEAHLILDVFDEYGEGCEDLKVGLHTYSKGGDVFIVGWTNRVCRHYMLDNCAEEHEEVVPGRHGEKYKTHYQLRLKRQVDLFFDSVEKVTHFFPVMPEEKEQIISDEFLRELLNRRSEQEFKNIVFSIQKRQGEIIQTPFKQNLIVQGCARSGKSMIMLHRLPILLLDNPNSLDKNNLYIITPSTAYIQMADKMRADLEIEDLKMGTLEQYYNYILEKYGCNPAIYGSIKPYLKLEEKDLKYVYSSECIDDIQDEIEEIIESGKVDYKRGYELFHLRETKEVTTTATPVERMRREVVKIQPVIIANDKNLKSYQRDIINLLEQLDKFVQMLLMRKFEVNRGIMRALHAESKLMAEKIDVIRKIDDYEKREIMYQSRLEFIKKTRNKIADLRETHEIVELDGAYFEKLKKKAKEIKQLIALFSVLKEEEKDIKFKDGYYAIENREMLCDTCEKILGEVIDLEDPYREYAASIVSYSKRVEFAIIRLKENVNVYLPFDYLQSLVKASAYFNTAIKDTVWNIYRSIMKRIGREPDQKEKADALECSPYLYLQIIYLFAGVPNGAKESLITIDEAQNMELEELKLIKAVNGNTVIFNLFGDVKQHIEGSKGIDDWKEIAEIADFKIDGMQENYRNARQITEFCNKRFKLEMNPINLDGDGVHVLQNEKEFEEIFVEIFQKPLKNGLSCIVVKNKKEAETLIGKAGMYARKIHDMTTTATEIKRNKWNLMTAEQAKGLEFETVFAISGRMGENEKYIAYTRALNELYVYDEEIALIEYEEKVTDEKEIDKKPEIGSIRKKRAKRKSKEKGINKN